MGDNEAMFRHSQVAVTGSSLHLVELGDPEAVPFLFLHGPRPRRWTLVLHDPTALTGPSPVLTCARGVDCQRDTSTKPPHAVPHADPSTDTSDSINPIMRS